MNVLEGGLYWTHLTDDQAYTDVVARYGLSRSRMNVIINDPDHADGVRGSYLGLSLEAGKPFDLGGEWRVEPKVKASYTHFSTMSMTTELGLRAKMKGYSSLTTNVGATLERGFHTQGGLPWKIYGKAFLEREWMKGTDVVFNDVNSYALKFQGNRFVYGLGADGALKNGATWHVGLERSSGGHFEEKWRVDANLRLPFWGI